MPYTEAVILETLRFSSMVPLGLFHKCLTTTEFHGFVIPKNTWIIANLYSGHHDKATWGDPETFRPERFLSPAGDKVMRHEALIPFSYGKRVCLGEALAKHELFLFLVSTFQQFLVTQDPSSPPPSTEARSTMLINIPLPHKLILHARK
jgi:cytochrome P450